MSRVLSAGQQAYNKHWADKVKKTVGELAYENHWSVQGLVASMGYTEEDIKAWVKSTKQSKK